MNARRWLQHLYALSATLRRCYLHALFRRPFSTPTRRLFVPPAPRTGAMPPAQDGAIQPAHSGTNALTQRDDCTIRLISTDDVSSRDFDFNGSDFNGNDYGSDFNGDHLAVHLSHLSQGEASAEIVSAVERLRVFASRNNFPLDDYWQTVRAGLARADEWVHYGIASRPAALNSFLPLPATHNETPHEEEPPLIFVLHCARDAHAPRHV